MQNSLRTAFFFALLSCVHLMTIAQVPPKEPSGIVTGRVTLDGKPAPGVDVMLQPALSTSSLELTAPRILRIGSIGADGSFRFSGVPPGKVKFMNLGHFPFRLVWLERHGIEQPDGLEVGSGEQISAIRLVYKYDEEEDK